MCPSERGRNWIEVSRYFHRNFRDRYIVCGLFAGGTRCQRTVGRVKHHGGAAGEFHGYGEHTRPSRERIQSKQVEQITGSRENPWSCGKELREEWEGNEKTQDKSNSSCDRGTAKEAARVFIHGKDAARRQARVSSRGRPPTFSRAIHEKRRA